MGEWYLKDNTPVLFVRTETCIRLSDFKRALAEYFYSYSSDFPNKMTKKRGFQILKERLYYQGKSGEYYTGYFESSLEEGEIFNKLLEKAENWILSKYPHFRTSQLK